MALLGRSFKGSLAR